MHVSRIGNRQLRRLIQAQVERGEDIPADKQMLFNQLKHIRRGRVAANQRVVRFDNWIFIVKLETKSREIVATSIEATPEQMELLGVAQEALHLALKPGLAELTLAHTPLAPDCTLTEHHLEDLARRAISIGTRVQSAPKKLNLDLEGDLTWFAGPLDIPYATNRIMRAKSNKTLVVGVRIEEDGRTIVHEFTCLNQVFKPGIWKKKEASRPAPVAEAPNNQLHKGRLKSPQWVQVTLDKPIWCHIKVACSQLARAHTTSINLWVNRIQEGVASARAVGEPATKGVFGYEATERNNRYGVLVPVRVDEKPNVAAVMLLVEKQWTDWRARRAAVLTKKSVRRMIRQYGIADEETLLADTFTQLAVDAQHISIKALDGRTLNIQGLLQSFSKGWGYPSRWWYKLFQRNTKSIVIVPEVDRKKLRGRWSPNEHYHCVGFDIDERRLPGAKGVFLEIKDVGGKLLGHTVGLSAVPITQLAWHNEGSCRLSDRHWVMTPLTIGRRHYTLDLARVDFPLEQLAAPDVGWMKVISTRRQDIRQLSAEGFDKLLGGQDPVYPAIGLAVPLPALGQKLPTLLLRARIMDEGKLAVRNKRNQRGVVLTRKTIDDLEQAGWLEPS